MHVTITCMKQLEYALIFMELDNLMWRTQTCKKCPHKGFMTVVFNTGLVRKNEFTDYWSTRLHMFSCDYFRKILRVFHIVDNSIIPARDDPSYRPSITLRPLLDYINNICIHYFCPGQAVAINES